MKVFKIKWICEYLVVSCLRCTAFFEWVSFPLQIYLHYQCMEAIVYSKRSLVLSWVSWRLIRSLFCWLIDKISAFFSSILKFLWGSFSVTIWGRIILKRTVVSDWRIHWERKSSSESIETCLSVSGVTASLGRWNWLVSNGIACKTPAKCVNRQCRG